jgi:hypothetical protein
VKYRNRLNIIELEGKELSVDRKEKWSHDRVKLLAENEKKFTSHLITHLHALAPLKQMMQMRVHFGHLNLSQWPRQFTLGCPYSGLIDVLNDPRAQAASTFNKVLLDAQTGVALTRKFVGAPEVFTSIYGPHYPLEEVEISHMLCVYFRTPQNIPVRLEADIDRNGENQYQLGSIRYFRDNIRNKHVEICNIDIERCVRFPESFVL